MLPVVPHMCQIECLDCWFMKGGASGRKVSGGFHVQCGDLASFSLLFQLNLH